MVESSTSVSSAILVSATAPFSGSTEATPIEVSASCLPVSFIAGAASNITASFSSLLGRAGTSAFPTSSEDNSFVLSSAVSALSIAVLSSAIARAGAPANTTVVATMTANKILLIRFFLMFFSFTVQKFGFYSVNPCMHFLIIKQTASSNLLSNLSIVSRYTGI